MDHDPLEQAALDSRRAERRTGAGLAIVGAVFLAAGVLLCVIGNPWMGAAALSFGAMCALTSIVHFTGEDAPAARLAAIIASGLFALTGAIMLVSGILAPGVWGWRGGVSAIIAGAICLGFFGLCTVLLIVRERRRRRLAR